MLCNPEFGFAVTNTLTYLAIRGDWINKMDNVTVIESFGAYNKRRYSRPWVCRMKSTGEYDFEERIGTYTGDMPGDAGDLIVFAPCAGQVYGYGQRDYRGNNTIIRYAIWTGEAFVTCDKLGRIKR